MSSNDSITIFEQYRRVLRGLAYRMTGSVSEADDIVQDAWLRWQAVDHTSVKQHLAFLARIVTRLCLDHAKSARARREDYVGQWLPEPIVDGAELAVSENPQTQSELAQDLSMALLLVMERLSPLERAAFLLHDVFDIPFEEIAAMLERSPEACRKLASRGRIFVKRGRPARAVSKQDANHFVEMFYRTMRSGDVAALARMLAADATLISDGGGKKTSALKPIQGREKIVRFFAGLTAKFGVPPPESIQKIELNGRDSLVIVEQDGSYQTWCFDWNPEGRITVIYLIRNPDKLAHLERLLQ